MPETLPDGAAVLAALTEPERRAALLLVYGTNGDVALAAARARELAPRDPVETRLLALMDLLAPAAAKAVVMNGPLGPRLVNAMTGVVEALDKHRGRGQQLVRVEHVHVHPGAQAVVGTVSQGAGGERRIEHRPLASGLAHERGAALRGEVEADRVAVPTGGGEGAVEVPGARRGRGQRRADGRAQRGVAARAAHPGGAGREGDAPAAARDGRG